MDKMTKCIKNVFGDFNESKIKDSMQLSDIDEWDSMNSVAFQVELESEFEVDMTGFDLNGDVTIKNLKKHLSDLGATV